MLPWGSKGTRGPSSYGLMHKLGRPVYYRQAIERMHRKMSSQSTNRLYDVQPEGYTFAQAFFEKHRLSRILARSVASAEHTFSPVRLNDIILGGRRRTVYSFTHIDHIVHAAVYAMLADDMQSMVSPHVYSYVKGRDKQQAITAMAKFVRAHRKKHPDPKTRGLYVLRCDIKAYGQSIPVGPSSLLWGQIRDAFVAAYRRPPTPAETVLLSALIRPVLMHPDGGRYQPLFGIPDGSSLSAWLLNLYASPLDEALSEIKGGLYARYGDDMVFAHEDPVAFAEAERRVGKVLPWLGLERSAAKSRRYYFNAAGRPAGDCKGITHIEFLGLRLAFDGTVSLKTEKTRLLLRDLSVRAKATARAMSHLPVERRGPALCGLLSDALDPTSMRPHPYASMLSRLVNDRGYLRHLDYLLARMVVRAMTGDTSAKGFRKLSYRTLRQSWQLRSLEYARNR